MNFVDQRFVIVVRHPAYFGSSGGSPPGAPGGGITRVVPGFGSGAGTDMALSRERAGR
jgi:hypothetical protein